MIGRRIAQWRALPGGERWRLVALAGLLPVVELSLQWLGAGRTDTWLENLLRPRARRAATAAELRRAERLVYLAAVAGRRSFVEARCLAQALAVRALLRRQGLAAELRIGVLKGAGGLDAHAWVELEGRRLSQAPLQHQPLQSPMRTSTLS